MIRALATDESRNICSLFSGNSPHLTSATYPLTEEYNDHRRFPALCSCCCTDLSVQVDICNAVEGKLVPIGAILVDVSHRQARQLPHCFVVTGHGSKFNGSQRKLLAVHAHTVTGQHEQRQQERATSVHGGRAFSSTSRVEGEVCPPVFMFSLCSDFWNENKC